MDIKRYIYYQNALREACSYFSRKCRPNVARYEGTSGEIILGTHRIIIIISIYLLLWAGVSRFHGF